MFVSPFSLDPAVQATTMNNHKGYQVVPLAEQPASSKRVEVISLKNVHVEAMISASEVVYGRKKAKLTSHTVQIAQDIIPFVSTDILYVLDDHS
ncbi:hypothetical protein D5086_002480 [Populus alba]|uniref:Uncharacterized protein n=2 Tax=Populus TaxID=3689 RepID=A0ACC4D385_POPAL|nr:hypothetical protein NC653_002963 [Populus alba x Populus x berolinensis]